MPVNASSYWSKVETDQHNNCTSYCWRKHLAHNGATGEVHDETDDCKKETGDKD